MKAFCRFLIFMYIRRKEMTRLDKDEEREERIHMEIIVDASGPEEQAIGWYNYLGDTLQFPFILPAVSRAAPSRHWKWEMKPRSWEWLPKRNASMRCSC